jgi:hypothetical protein
MTDQKSALAYVDCRDEFLLPREKVRLRGNACDSNVSAIEVLLPTQATFPLTRAHMWAPVSPEERELLDRLQAI